MLFVFSSSFFEDYFPLLISNLLVILFFLFYQKNRIYQANGAVTANTAFTVGTTGATWKEISKTGNSITSELSFEDATATYYYVSLLVDGNWKVIRYKLDDINIENTATISDNAGQQHNPIPLPYVKA